MDDDILDFSFFMPTRIIFGPGSLARLPDLVEELGGARASVFLVTGRQSLRAQGTQERVLRDISRFRVVHYDGALPFPSPELVDQAREACRQAAPNLVVAIGGGSALDMGKLMAILMTNPGPSIDYGTGHRQITERGVPFIAVPTTSGSSSEVTSGAALWQMDQAASFGVNHPYMFPTIALVDPDLAMSMPGELAGASGMDAFTRIHRRRASGQCPEAARGCSCESGIMVSKQQSRPQNKEHPIDATTQPSRSHPNRV